MRETLRRTDAVRDQRTYIRYPLDLEVRYIRDNEVRCCFTRDLSAGGVRLKTDEEFTIGESYPVLLDLPTVEEGGTICVHVEIRHVKPIEGSWKKIVGAVFKEITEGDREKIHHFIARRRKLHIDNQIMNIARGVIKKSEETDSSKVVQFPKSLIPAAS